MASAQNQIGAFWQLFAAHQREFSELSNPEDLFWDLALDELKKVDEHLWFELSAIDTAPREFIVTAEGHVETFPIVEALIDLAPKTKDWDFVALKPPMGFAFTTNYEGVLFEPSRMWFLPLEIPSRSHDFGMRVGIEKLESTDKTRAHNAVLVILDTALGERSAALDVQYTEVAKLPKDPASLGYIELPELSDYIAWRKRSKGS